MSVRRAIAAAALAWPTLAPAQTLGGGGGSGDGVSIARILLSLILCLVVAVLAILLIRKRGGRADLGRLFARVDVAREIAVVETRRISPHADVCVLRHRARDYLIVVQPNAVVVLRDSPSEPEPAACG